MSKLATAPTEQRASGAQPGDELERALGALAPYEVPMAPTEAEWAAMSAPERQRVVDSLPAGLTPAEIEAMTDGDWHWDAKADALDMLRRYFGGLGKRIYLAAERRVYYPGQRSFVPDLLAVLDVDPKKRTKWVVSAEGKGLDWVLEVLHLGDRKKDLEDNVGFYASLGIQEYFIYDCGLQLLWGYRLPGPASQRYDPIPARDGRYSSAVLGLDLGLGLNQLQFYHGSAELKGATGLIRQLNDMLTAVQERRQADWTTAERERLRAEATEALLKTEQERARQNLRAAILAVLRARGLDVTEEHQQRLLACEDAALLERLLARASSAPSAAEALED